MRSCAPSATQGESEADLEGGAAHPARHRERVRQTWKAELRTQRDTSVASLSKTGISLLPRTCKYIYIYNITSKLGGF